MEVEIVAAGADMEVEFDACGELCGDGTACE